MASIGKLWGDAGLSDLLIDSSIYASATTDQMLAGKQFNRGVRGLMLPYEALSALRLASYFRWCNDREVVNSITQDFWTLAMELSTKFERYTEVKGEVTELLRLVDRHILPLLEDFRRWGCET
jgi:hypothetical protein